MQKDFNLQPATEIAGVRIPDGILFFDCRLAVDKPMPETHYGEKLWGGEYAAYSLGLRLSWGERYDHPAHTVIFRFDSRKQTEMCQTARVVNDILEQYRQLKSLYHETKYNWNAYEPVACYLTNCSAGVIADRRRQLGAEKRGKTLKGKPALNPAGRKPAKADQFIIEDEHRPNCRTYRLLCGDRIVARDVLPEFVELLASAGLLAEVAEKRSTE